MSIAISRFTEALSDPTTLNAIDEPDVLSLVGAAALRADWSTDIGVLSEPCLVVKA